MVSRDGPSRGDYCIQKETDMPYLFCYPWDFLKFNGMQTNVKDTPDPICCFLSAVVLVIE